MIELERRDSTTIVRMVRGRGNSLNLAFCRELAETFGRLEVEGARSVVLTGEGRVFGAGVDLRELLAGGPDYIREFLPAMLGLFRRLAVFPKPLVAAVNGHAIAGGAIMVLACDQRLLARGTARVGLTEVVVGVVFPPWALEIARFATPPEHFSTLIGTGRTWLPDDALARGLVDELVDAERLLERACEVAAEMGALAPDVFAANKLAVRRPLIETADGLAAEIDQKLIESWCTPESLSRVSEFVARTIKTSA